MIAKVNGMCLRTRHVMFVPPMDRSYRHGDGERLPAFGATALEACV